MTENPQNFLCLRRGYFHQEKERGGVLDRVGCAGHQPGMVILKILRAPEWADLRAAGSSAGAMVDVADGFIHFSTVAQAPETAAKHFTGEDELMLLGVETDRLGDALHWEESRGGALFPHLYRELRMSDVAWAQPLPLVGGLHQFPAGLE